MLLRPDNPRFDNRISDINSDPFTMSLHIFEHRICDTNKRYCDTNPTISLRAIHCSNDLSCYALKLRQQSTLSKAQTNLSENHRPLPTIYFRIKCWTPLKPTNKQLEQTANNEHIIQSIVKRSNQLHMNVFILCRNATKWNNTCRYDTDHVYAFHTLDSDEN